MANRPALAITNARFRAEKRLRGFTSTVLKGSCFDMMREVGSKKEIGELLAWKMKRLPKVGPWVQEWGFSYLVSTFLLSHLLPRLSLVPKPKLRCISFDVGSCLGAI
ncbi:hypothetical protein VN97_g4355 [Penicillium thymicola]|uniref:Uncharacterized protein n=1 Tax=Penicillium thymicola TaxID=293382 RepID=A0AAI9TKV7_PENTH|nr:hypothetical protein VN97_g4355 [Penicillium thymicola]